MDEVFPVVAGVVLGLASHWVVSPRIRASVLVILSLVLGTIASLISGELAISWGYVLIDVAQVLVAAFMTSVLAGVWGARRDRWWPSS